MVCWCREVWLGGLRAGSVFHAKDAGCSKYEKFKDWKSCVFYRLHVAHVPSTMPSARSSVVRDMTS